MESTDALAQLQTFRAAAYACFGRRADALFELCDAALTAGVVPSPPHLSLEPSHRRGWGSLYAALAQGGIDDAALRTLLVSHPLGAEPPIYAVDVSVWPRCDAEASPERGYYYHPSRHSAGQPIVAGWAYQWVAQLGLNRDSWTAPMDVRRVHPAENAHSVAATQVRALVASLPADHPVPTFVFDAGYDPLQLALELGDSRAAILVRLRRGRSSTPSPRRIPASVAPAGTGRSLSATIRPPGRSRPTSGWRTTSSTAASACALGRTCTASRGRVAAARSGRRSRSCQARSS